MYFVFQSFKNYKVLINLQPGGNSYRETPVTIPNTEVKPIAPMVLAWRRAGRVGTARLFIKDLKLLGF